MLAEHLRHSDGFKPSKGGYFLLAADVTRRDEYSAFIDFYTSKHYAAIAETVGNWPEGSQMCHGIGGNP